MKSQLDFAESTALVQGASEVPVANVIIVQPVVPTYRIRFFERVEGILAGCCRVYASDVDLGVLTDRKTSPAWEQRLGPIRRMLLGLEWQSGALSITIQRGDVVVISGAPRCLSNILLLLKARIKGARSVWWGHYWSSTSRPWRASLRLLLAQLSDALLFYTDREVLEYAQGSGGRSKPLVFALNNGIETEEITRLRAPYDPALRGRRLLFVGRVTEKAGIQLLLRALAEPACASAKLYVIGCGDYERMARELAATLGVADRIIWLGPSTDEARIAAAANRCALFVYPGSIGLSLIHGLAYGLPAIVHDDRWAHMPEIAALRPGVNGFQFQKGNPAALSRAIADALSDPARLVTMSAAAIASTAHTFNAEDMAERFCAAIAVVRTPSRGSTRLQREATR